MMSSHRPVFERVNTHTRCRAAHSCLPLPLSWTPLSSFLLQSIYRPIDHLLLSLSLFLYKPFTIPYPLPFPISLSYHLPYIPLTLSHVSLHFPLTYSEHLLSPPHPPPSTFSDFRLQHTTFNLRLAINLTHQIIDLWTITLLCGMGSDCQFNCGSNRLWSMESMSLVIYSDVLLVQV